MAIHAETIREGESDTSARRTTGLRSSDEGPLGCRAVPEVALQVEHLGLLDHGEIKVFRLKLSGCSEIGAHRALRIGSHIDETAGCCGADGGGRRLEPGSHGADVMAED